MINMSEETNSPHAFGLFITCCHSIGTPTMLGSLVSKVTEYGLDDRDQIPGRGRDLRHLMQAIQPSV